MHKSILDKINYADEMARIELIFSEAPIVQLFRYSNFGFPDLQKVLLETYLNDK